MLSEEEKKAIDKLSSKKNETTWNDTIRQIKREEITDVVVTRQKYITTILNLIEKQNKIIDKMAEYIKEPYQLYLIKGRKTKIQAIIEYFRDKIKEDK